MDFLALLHPQIVHTPIVMLIVGLAFELVGLATRKDWWRRAAFVMLLLGALGAGAAVLSGRPTGEVAERSGVPEQAVDTHEERAMVVLWLAVSALVVRAVAALLRRGRRLITALALALWLAAAVAVGLAAHSGGQLVFQHGAAVHAPARSVAAPGRPDARGTQPARETPDRD